MGEAKTKTFIKNSIKGFFFKKKIIIIVIIVAIILLAGFEWEADAQTVKNVSEVAQSELAKSVSIEGKYWKIDDDIYQKIETKLKEQGIDVKGLGDGSTDYLQKIVKAELVTNYPNLGEEVDKNDKNKFQGIVNFIRRDAEGSNDGQLMEYMTDTEFNQYVTDGNYEMIKNAFTIDFGVTQSNENSGNEENSGNTTNSVATASSENLNVQETEKTNMQIVIATKSENNGVVSISTQKINYQMQVANYSMPMEFIFAHLQMTNSVDYATAIADLVISNSKIDYMIQDCYSETIVKNTYKYDQKNIETNGNTTTVTSINEGIIEVQSTETVKNWTVMPYIKEADIWIANISNKYDKREIGPTTSMQNIVELEDQSTSNYIRYNRTTYDEITNKSITYVSTTSSNSGSIGSGTAADGDGYEQEYTRNGRTYREYKQSRGSYRSELYSEGTMASSGCGPTAVAIVASGYVDGYSPLDVANSMGGAHNGGTTVSNMSEAFNKMGIDNKMVIPINNKNQILDELKQGKTMVLSVNNNLNGLLAVNTHIIAVLDVDDNNNVYVSNPNPNKATGWISIDDVFACANGRHAVVVENITPGENNNQTNSSDGEETNSNNSNGENSLENVLFIGDSWLDDTSMQSKFSSTCTFKAKIGKTAQYWNSQTTSGVSNVSAITIMLGLNNPDDTTSMKKLIDKLMRRIS